MDRTALLNNKGVSLIEMMISIVILLIVALALMQTASLGIATNMENAVRDEAVNFGELRMNRLMQLPFTEATTHSELSSSGTDTNVRRNLRGFEVEYTAARTISNINVSTKQITLTVTWEYRGKNYSHEISTIKRRG